MWMGQYTSTVLGTWTIFTLRMAKSTRTLVGEERTQLTTVIQLYSMTKLVVAVAILQQVDKGTISLDDAALVETYAPELCKLPILTGFDDAGKPLYKDRITPITLRHLLTHTSGLGYDFLSMELTQWVQTTGAPGIWKNDAGIKGFEIPLLFEPGTKYAYSVGIDWAGIILERVTGETLDSYFQKNIFAPLGIKTISFIAPPEVQAKMQTMIGRNVTTDELQPSTGAKEVGTEIAQMSGGAGLVGTAKDYLRFLQGVLAGGTEKGSPIVSKTAFKTLFTDAFPKREENNSCHADLSMFMTAIGFTDPNNTANNGQNIGQSVGFALDTADSCFGRKAGTGTWLGAAKTYYWVDPASGVAVSVRCRFDADLQGLCGTQIINPGIASNLTFREPILDVYNKFERKLYNGLQ